MIWLSHSISSNTQEYAGGKSFSIKKTRSMSKGDSCNQISISFSNHFGTHVDAPRHFIEDGKEVSDYYNVNDWVFTHPLLLDIPTTELGVINEESFLTIDKHLDVDLLLIRTGFEKHRGRDAYWKMTPVFDQSIVNAIDFLYPNVRAIALDTISISSLSDRQKGRECHRAILGRDIRIFEDISMKNIYKPLKKVIALPLRIECVDGVPLTIIGYFE